MAFHHIRFPLDVALGARGGPERMTDIVTLANGKEERNQRWANSRRKYNAGYGVKSRQDMRAILAFFEERRGRFHGFLWRDGLDFSSNDGGEITAFDQEIGIGDGSKSGFQIVKKYGGDFDPYLRKIYKPVADTLKVSLDDVEVMVGDFGVDENSGILSLNVAPLSGVIIKVGFEFNVAVRFDIDKLDVDLFSFEAAQIPNIPLIELVL
jgi:uncharacterized protein (TIGR02217 family)